MNLPANINRNANDHSRNGNASNEGNPNWSTNQCAQLPKNFLLTAPWLLAPECAARGAEVMQVRDLFHTKPTEFTATHCTGHMITASIIHLDNVSTASWAWLDVIWSRFLPITET